MKQQNRSILITGCSTGIGNHCAKRLREEGWQVFATARKQADCLALEKAGLGGLYLDYRDAGSIRDCVSSVLEKTDGRLDALFNNGAYGQPGAVEDLPTDILREQFEANFFGWHTLTNLVVPVMRKQGQGEGQVQGQGRIVHCSSVLGWVPSPWRGAYNSSKFALEGLASTMRLELKGTDIHVSLIEPGPIESQFTINGLEHFKAYIDVENSPHRESYKKELERLESNGGVNRFRLGPEAVYKKLDHALNSAYPRAHYAVTVPTHVMNLARRFLPQGLVDRIILAGS